MTSDVLTSDPYSAGVESRGEGKGFLERTVAPIGTSGKADVPRRYLGRRVYVIITKNVVEGKDVKQ